VTYDAEQFRRAAAAFAAVQSPSQGVAMLQVTAMLESAVAEAERLRAGSRASLVLFPAVVCPSCSRFAPASTTG